MLDRFTAARQEAGLTTQQLACDSGLSIRDIEYLEQKPNPTVTLAMLARYAEGLGLELEVSLKQRDPISGGRS